MRQQVLVVGYMVTAGCLDGVVRGPRPRVLASSVHGVIPMRVIWDVVLPSAIPSIWTGMKIGVGSRFRAL